MDIRRNIPRLHYKGGNEGRLFYELVILSVSRYFQCLDYTTLQKKPESF